MVELIELVPGGSQRLVGDQLGAQRGDRCSARWSADKDRGGIGPSDSCPHQTRRRDVGALGEHQREADVLDLLEPTPEHRQAGIVVHRLVPQLGGDAGVPLVAPESVDSEPLARRKLDVHHRRPGDALVRGSDARDLVAQVGERGPDLGHRRTSPRGTERNPHERGDGEAHEQPAEHIGRKAGAEVHRGEGDQDDDDGEHATEGTHDVRREPERRAR